jgi:hypothetical protein
MTFEIREKRLFGRRVWLKGQPVTTEEGEDREGIVPVASQEGKDEAGQFGDGGEDAVADIIFDDVPELLAGVEFWRVGREVDDAHAIREPGVAVLEVEAGMIADHDMDGLRVAGGDQIPEVNAIPTLIDIGNMAEVGRAAKDVERSVEVVPLIFDLPGHDRTPASQSPKSSHFGMQAEAGLVYHPEFDPAACPKRQGLEFIREFFAKLFFTICTPFGKVEFGKVDPLRALLWVSAGPPPP